MSHGLASTFLRRVEWSGHAGFADAVRETEADSEDIRRVREARQQQREFDREAERVRQKTARLLREAALEVSKYSRSAGMRRHAKDVVERIARDNRDIPKLDLSAVLASAVRESEERDFMRDIEAIFPGRWLTEDEVAAMRPLAA